jgi:hypothetical protein
MEADSMEEPMKTSTALVLSGICAVAWCITVAYLAHRDEEPVLQALWHSLISAWKCFKD